MPWLCCTIVIIHINLHLPSLHLLLLLINLLLIQLLQHLCFIFAVVLNWWTSTSMLLFLLFYYLIWLHLELGEWHECTRDIEVVNKQTADGQNAQFPWQWMGRGLFWLVAEIFIWLLNRLDHERFRFTLWESIWMIVVVSINC